MYRHARKLIQPLRWIPCAGGGFCWRLSYSQFFFPSIKCTYLVLYRVVGQWSLYLLTLKERQGTPWTGRLSITRLTQRDRQPCTLTPTANLESPINLTCISVDAERNWKPLETTLTVLPATPPYHPSCIM